MQLYEWLGPTPSGTIIQYIYSPVFVIIYEITKNGGGGFVT